MTIRLLDKVKTMAIETAKEENNRKLSRIETTNAKKERINEIAESYIHALFYDFSNIEELDSRFTKLVKEYNATEPEIEKLLQVKTFDSNPLCSDTSIHYLMKEKCAKRTGQKATDAGKKIYSVLKDLTSEVNNLELIRAETAQQLPAWLTETAITKYFTPTSEVMIIPAESRILLENDDNIKQAKADIKALRATLQADTTHGIHHKVNTDLQTANAFVVDFEKIVGDWLNDIISRDAVVSAEKKAERQQKANEFTVEFTNDGKVKVKGLNSTFRRKVKHLYAICEELEIDAIKRRELCNTLVNTYYVELNSVSACEDWLATFKAE